jgi:hypothetical protein
MMLSTHPSTGGQSSVVPRPSNYVTNVGFADLDLEVQNALHAFVFKGDLFDPVAEQARATDWSTRSARSTRWWPKTSMRRRMIFNPSRQGFGALMSVFQGFSQVLNQNITTTLALQIR